MKAALVASLAEVRFVTLCVSEPHGASTAELLGAARAIQDWDKVVELATRHRLAAYVVQSIERAGIEIPGPPLGQLRQEALSSLAVTMLLDAELERIASALNDAAIPVLVLKGPALARTIYPQRGLRPYADLDLTVQEKDEADAAGLLTAIGYCELTNDAEVGHRAHLAHRHESGSFHRLFADANERVLVELHLDPLQLGVAPVCEEHRWTSAIPVPDLIGALMLSPEDQVIQLSVHVHKHGFSRLIWLKDLDLLLRKHGDDIDWPSVVRLAKLEGLGGSVWYALELAHRLLRTPLPTDIAALCPSPATRLLYRAVWPAGRIMRLEGFLRRRAIQFHAADSWRGMLPSLFLLGRKPVRARLLFAALFGR